MSCLWLFRASRSHPTTPSRAPAFFSRYTLVYVPYCPVITTAHHPSRHSYSSINPSVHPSARSRQPHTLAPLQWTAPARAPPPVAALAHVRFHHHAAAAPSLPDLAHAQFPDPAVGPTRPVRGLGLRLGVGAGVPVAEGATQKAPARDSRALR